MKRLVFTSFLFIILLLESHAQTCFTPIWTGNGLDHLNFYITLATVNGVDMQPGDEIAVFDGNDCVGVSTLTEVLTGSNYLQIKCSLDDPDTPEKDGFTVGNTASFRLCVNSGTEIVTNVDAVYSSTGSGVFSASGTAVAQLSGETECSDPPSITLSSSSGSTCSSDPLTVSGNTFGGSATSVSITENGAGDVSPLSTGTSPFSFTYTPASGDIGNTVIITVTSDNPLGDPCTEAVATYSLTVTPDNTITLNSAAGTDNQELCINTSITDITYTTTGATGANITGLPAGVTGGWSANEVTISGTPTASGTFNYTVTLLGGCGSVTAEGTIKVNPLPTISILTAPECSPDLTTYSVSVTVSSGTVTSTAGTVTNTGTNEWTVSGVAAGTDITLTVTDGNSCESILEVTSPDCSCPVIAAPVSGGDEEYCEGDAIPTISASVEAGETVDWYADATGGSPLAQGSLNFTPTAPGTYYAEARNTTSDCTSSTRTAITVTENPSPESPSQTVDCSGGPGNAVVTVTSPTGSGLEYSLDGGTFQSSTTFNGVANGSHVITVRNADGCTTTGSSFDVSCGCAYPPTVTLSSTSGNTCGTDPVTVSDNTFGGSATTVSITHDGAGNVSPASANTSPFDFTYTPAASDQGQNVQIRLTTDNPLGSPCSASTATYTLTVNAIPGAPVPGTITHPTCESATGSVVLNGLPSSGTWTVIGSPSDITKTGSVTSTTVTGIPAGTYTFTVTNVSGCTSEPSGDVVINAQPPVPTAPLIGTITQPTCELSTGSFVLEGLPSTGTWTITRSPGSVTITGTGTSTTFSNLLEGTYRFTVTNSFACTSEQSAEVLINPQPETPSRPSVGTITPPSCSVATGSVNLFGLPSTGAWTLTRYPGTVTTTGTGSSTTISGLATGTYNFTVTNAVGCTSLPSSNVVIPAQPPTSTAPLIGMIIQPTYEVQTGSVVLEGLPSSGSWTVTRTPGNVITTGTGTSTTITGLEPGVFNFTVTNSFGCTSLRSDDVIIATPGTPTLIITDPDPVCYPETVDLTADEITEGSTPGLTYTYWLDSEATEEYETPAEAIEGTYYIRGTTVSGFFDIKPVVVTVDQPPVADAGPDQVLEYVFFTDLNATLLGEHDQGLWEITEGTGTIDNDTLASTSISSLELGETILLWSVSNGVCPVSDDYLVITVNDLVIPTLITPNGDPYNEYFVLRGLEETLGSTELVIFDRRGAQVYRNENYDNSWNGVDHNGNPLPDDTYFYTIRPANGHAYSGYIVIQR